ncbi:hypothetical protein KIPB_007971, partial [Kipferlia bialata]|eukprot:g7971.t1
MHKADDWDLLVSEDVASALTKISERDKYIGQESLMGSAVSLEYICTRPALNFLKGKGLFPCRRVFLSERCLGQTEQCLGETLSDVLGGLVGRHTTWTERMLAPAQYLHRHLGQGKSGTASDTDTDTPRSIQKVASTDYIADIILHQPWAVIRATFATSGSMSHIAEQTQGGLSRQNSAPCLAGSREDLTEGSEGDGCSIGGVTQVIAVDGDSNAPAPLALCFRDSDMSDGLDEQTQTQSLEVEVDAMVESESESGAQTLPVVDALPVYSPSRLDRWRARRRERLAEKKRERERKRRVPRRRNMELPCPDIQTLDSQLLDDLEGVHESASLPCRLSGTALDELTDAVWNRGSISPGRRLLLTIRSIPQVFKMSCDQNLCNTSVFMVMHTLVKIYRKRYALWALTTCQVLMSVACLILRRNLMANPPKPLVVLLQDSVFSRTWDLFYDGLLLHTVFMVARFFTFPYTCKVWADSLLRLLEQAFFSEGSGQITAYSRIRKEYRKINISKVATQVAVMLLVVIPCRWCSMLTSRGQELGIGSMSKLGSFGMLSSVMMLNESVISLFVLNDVDSVVVVCINLLMCPPMAVYLLRLSRESSLVFLPTLMVTLFSLIVSINQVANMCVSVRQLVETVAGQTLVGRVASGRYFSRILSPVIAGAAGLFDVQGAIYEKAALRFVAKNRDKPTPPGVEGTVLVSMLYDQVVDLTKRLGDGISTPLPETQGFISAYYQGLTADSAANSPTNKSCEFPEEPDSPLRVRVREVLTLFRGWYPLSVSATSDRRGSDAASTTPSVSMNSISETSATPVPGTFKVKGLRGRIATVHQVPGECVLPGQDMMEDRDLLPPDAIEVSDTEESVDISVSERTLQKDRDTKELMRRHEISFFPLCVYVKLDIVGFTTFCQSQSSNHVVSTLKQLFTGLDDLVLREAGIGVTKVKTVGDAYE